MIHICLHCKKEYKNQPARKFCSRRCHKLFAQKILVESGQADYRTVKRYLINVHGNICSDCGLSIWKQVSIPLVLDHKDGNSSNNTLENCRLLCNNCDALTSTYKGRNKGNGRFNRRQRYLAGKSY